MPGMTITAAFKGNMSLGPPVLAEVKALCSNNLVTARRSGAETTDEKGRALPFIPQMWKAAGGRQSMEGFLSVRT